MKRGAVRQIFRAMAALACGCMLLVIAFSKAAADVSTAVLLYPEMRAPFSNVFDDMMRGVESSFSGRVKRIAVTKGTSAEEIEKKIAEESAELVFILGSRSLKMIAEVKPELPILSAGITANGPSTAGISMLPDPRVVLDKLFLIKGKIGKVFVVSRTNRYDDQIKMAEAYLAKTHSTLEPTRVASIQEAAKAYRNILDKVKPGDAIWILPSAPYLDNSVLSVILEQAWKRRILVFSSNPSHVKRGVLFAVYPDNVGMGVSLGRLGNKVIQNADVQHGLQPLQDVLLAVNERTAKHLGIDLGDVTRAEIDLMLPAR